MQTVRRQIEKGKANLKIRVIPLTERTDRNGVLVRQSTSAVSTPSLAVSLVFGVSLLPPCNTAYSAVPFQAILVRLLLRPCSSSLPCTWRKRMKIVYLTDGLKFSHEFRREGRNVSDGCILRDDSLICSVPHVLCVSSCV